MTNDQMQPNVEGTQRAKTNELPFWPTARARTITFTSLTVLWLSTCAGGLWISDKSELIGEALGAVSLFCFAGLILLAVFETLWKIGRWVRRLFT